MLELEPELELPPQLNGLPSPFHAALTKPPTAPPPVRMPGIATPGRGIQRDLGEGEDFVVVVVVVDDVVGTVDVVSDCSVIV